ncbi:MAG TPA: alkaline phosphatase family protein [Candidatus Tumulicola sp.]
MNRFRVFAFAAALVASAGCSSSINTPAPVPTTSNNPGAAIQHVIVMFQENRSFNNIFMGYPGAETSTTGACAPFRPPGSQKTYCADGQPVALKPITLETCRCIGGFDIEHGHRAFETEYNGGKMDGFDAIHQGTVGIGPWAGLYPYAYVVRREVQPYWDLAGKYTLADHMFSTATTDSFVAHQEIIAGTTRLNSHESLTDTPSTIPWGCDNEIKSTTTGVILTSGKVLPFGGPFPCFTQYKTMADVLDAANVSWKFYVAPFQGDGADFSGGVWNGFDAIKAVRYGADWKAHISMPNTNVLKDLQNGTLPSVSWVIPVLADSDHPASGNNKGPSWVTSVVNAVGKSPYWNSTAIVVLWDDWGGYYDGVPPPQLDYTSLGMRVPMIVISPFAKPHYISKTQYEFGSILKFIEQNFGTGSLGTSDVRANSIGDVFDFTQQAQRFQAIKAPYPESYFLGHRTQPNPRAVLKHDRFVPD